jgi:hypothetical protein
LSDYTLELALTLIVGMSGSGKSTFAFRYLLNAPAACRFIFDDLGRAATRLGVHPCYTAAELEAALSTKWVLFNPKRMFPDGDYKAAFRYFCHWVFDASKRGQGKKFFLVDEIWQWQDRDQIPRELDMCVRLGREENIELVSATQSPSLINASITGQATELVCFRLDEPKELACVRRLGTDPDAVQALPLGTFLSANRLSRSRLSGKVF